MEELGVIGNGSFGLIKKVRRVADGKILARKEIDYKKMSEKEKRQLVSEVNILRELKHPNIVRYYERQVDKANSMIFIIMEYCEGGDLSHVIKRCRKEEKHLPEQIVVNILSQLVLALYECHHGSGKKNHATILHRDIKPENVFIDSDSNIKLGDFGLSKVLMSDSETEFAKTYVGTPFYMSPELVNDSMYNIKSDIWALGCLIYEICALEPPFQSKTQQGLSSKIRQGKVDPLPSYYSNDLNRIVRAMLNVDQTKRPLTKDLIRIPKVQLYIRESEIEKVEIELTRKEQELNFRESAILRKEIQLNVRHETLNAKESELNERESRFMRKPLESLNRTLSCTPTKYKNQAMPMSDVKARLTPIDIHKHRGNGGFSIKKLEKEMHEMMISP